MTRQLRKFRMYSALKPKCSRRLLVLDPEFWARVLRAPVEPLTKGDQ